MLFLHRAAAAREAAEEAEAERWVAQLAVEGAGSEAETAAQLEVRFPRWQLQVGSAARDLCWADETHRSGCSWHGEYPHVRWESMLEG